MKSYSSSELVQLIGDIWIDVAKEIPELSNFPDDIEIETNKPGYVCFSVTAEYSPPAFCYFHLQKLSDLFGTQNISLGDNVDISGCETCDYGSKYGYEIVIKPNKKE